MDKISEVTISQLSHIKIDVRPPEPEQPNLDAMQAEHESLGARESDVQALGALATNTAKQEVDPNDPSTWGKVRRNEACPCGSGKKYKHCHGAHNFAPEQNSQTV